MRWRRFALAEYNKKWKADHPDRVEIHKKTFKERHPHYYSEWFHKHPGKKEEYALRHILKFMKAHEMLKAFEQKANEGKEQTNE